MLRILALTSCYPEPTRPGAGAFVERQLGALVARGGVEVEVVTPVGIPPFPLSLHPRYRLERGLPGEEILRGIRVHRPRFPLLPHRLVDRSLAIARALHPVLAEVRRRFPFDLIHAEFFWPDGSAARRLAAPLGLPYTVKARGPDFEHSFRRPATAPLLLEAGKGAAGMLAVSEALREAMIGAGLPAERIAVHRTGLDSSRFHLRDRNAAKAALRVEGPLLLCVGNLSRRKRHGLALEALRLIEGATLILVGSGPERPALERQARALGLDRRVRMTGSLPNELLPAFFAAADVTVHTATGEGLANVWIESLACGTPVVTTDAGGAREAIDRPEAGRIVAAEPAAIAAAVSEILASPPAPEAVAAAAAGFSWERNAAELEAHLRAAIASDGRR